MGRIIPIGVITAPWGIRGHVKIFPFTDRERRFSKGSLLYIDGKAFKVEESRKKGRIFIVKLEGVNSRNEAEGMRKREVGIPEEELERLGEGEYYPHELMGLKVLVEDEEIGEVVDILETPSNFVLIVHGKYGEVLLPFIEDVIKEVEPGNKIRAERIKGLLPEA